MKAFVISALVATGVLSAAAPSPCPSEFLLGSTYHEIQSGPCPTIDSVASFKAPDGIHVGYLCRARRTMVVGSIVTGEMDAFFLFDATDGQ